MERIFRNLFLVLDGYINLLLHLLHIRRNKEYTKRLKICNGCQYKKGLFCGKCGCLLKAKCCTDYPISEIDGLSIGGCPLIPPKW